jgi:hypothetical protein
MRDVITPTMLDRFCTSAGPARLSLLSMVRDELNAAPPWPESALDALEPLIYLIEQARSGAATLDAEHGLHHQYALSLNRTFGFQSAPLVDGRRTHLEFDMLLTLSRAMRATIAGDRTEIITPIGMSLLKDPQSLWRAAAGAVPALGMSGVVGDMWELLLAWLLIDEDEFQAQYAALIEVGDGKGVGDQHATFAVAIYSLYTLARGLQMFVPREPHVMAKPRLTEFGRATAIEALRSAVLIRWNHFESIS